MRFLHAAIAAFICMVVFLHPQVAWADPHAVFYTTIGQQQLFFNVLAALNQADYAEPATDTVGTPASDSRQEVLDRRATAGFGPEQDDRVNATKTELASVLTRGITLEGNDLWTSYLMHQLALEVARRNGIDEIVRVYCERGLGMKACEDETDNPQQEQRAKREAYVVNEAERSVRAGFLGIRGAVFSDKNPNGYYQNLLSNLEQPSVDDDDPYKDLQDYPVPYDAPFSQARENSQDNIYQQLAVERLAILGQQSFQAPFIDTNTLEHDIAIDGNTGQVSLPESEGGENENFQGYANRYMNAIFGLLELPNAAIATAQRGARLAQSHLESTEVQGSVADVEAQPPERQGGATLGRAIDITVPANAKVAAIQSATDALVEGESNRQQAPAVAEHQVGDAQSVNRGDTGAAVSGATTGSTVAGTTHDHAPTQVAGVSTLSSEEDDPDHHQDETVKLNPNTNLKNFHHEQGPVHFLKGIGVDASVGCGCQHEDIIEGAIEQIIQAMQ